MPDVRTSHSLLSAIAKAMSSLVRTSNAPAPSGVIELLVARVHLRDRVLDHQPAPGGTLLVISHDRDNITRGHGGPQDPGRLYTPASVTAKLDGLAIRRAEQVLRPVRASDGERTAIDTLVRAERPSPPAAG